VQPQHLLLTLLGDFWLGRREAIPSSALVDILAEFGVTSANARAALSRLARRGLLTPSRQGRRTAYALTPEAADVLAEGTRRIFAFGAPVPPWDGTWTVVAFSLPEPRRDLRHVLRTRLRWAGFAPHFDGVWFAPGNREATAADVLKELEVESATIVVGPASGPEVPTAAWDLHTLRARYEAFLASVGPLRDLALARATTAAEALVARTAMIDSWRTFPSSDPELPSELLPDDWPGPTAHRYFTEVYDLLGPLATARFRQIIAAHDPGLAALAAHHTAAEANIAPPLDPLGPAHGPLAGREVVATAIANAEAQAPLTASPARIVAAADAARRRIERDLHDGAQQRFVHTIVTLKLARRALADVGGEGPELVDEALENAERATEELRELARGIHPSILTSRGLGPALEALARRSNIPVTLKLPTDARLPEHVEVTAYFVVSEALTNAAKHAHASCMHVTIDTADGDVRLSIRDDGVGGADPTRGSGLAGLKDRVEAIGGTLTVQSRPGQGTRLIVEVPVNADRERSSS
jgi:phenylacetic acid degradation operon negative regulatory protein